MVKNRHVRVDEDTRVKLKDLSHELSKIEGDAVRIGEIVKRMINGPNIANELRAGSITRRRFKK